MLLASQPQKHRNQYSSKTHLRSTQDGKAYAFNHDTVDLAKHINSFKASSVFAVYNHLNIWLVFLTGSELRETSSHFAFLFNRGHRLSSGTKWLLSPNHVPLFAVASGHRGASVWAVPCLQRSTALSPQGLKCSGLTKEAAIDIHMWNAVLTVCKTLDCI